METLFLLILNYQNPTDLITNKNHQPKQHKLVVKIQIMLRGSNETKYFLHGCYLR